MAVTAAEVKLVVDIAAAYGERIDDAGAVKLIGLSTVKNLGVKALGEAVGWVPLVGWAYSSAAGFPIVLFGVLPLPDFVSASKPLAELIKPWHQITAFALAGLVVLHVAAAIKHHFIDKDGLLLRMMPGKR